ncbi:glycosyltransferase family 4 protein [Serpens gallinarum]|uniref:Glycosyltransferase family 4 protein n=1 Tax=Serpens gallinarum TaxID=2763075 RepID=A0ABR8TTB9_9PSED|nr:glycosyltransferase family 4 protein [Serpens gallinarum]MBD7978569.1 glycosyltransferase family 4 protein [Serpens gallinarum]
MKILLLSFYYQPDLSAGSFRTTALVKSLLDSLPRNAHVEVITTLPNRYNSFSLKAPLLEQHPRLTVHRIPLSEHKSGMLDQSRAFLGYLKGVLKITKNNNYSVVYATSSRLMTAALGALVSKRVRSPLYLDIRDIFVDTIKDVLPSRFARLAKPLFSLIERLTIQAATKVNLVSAGFLPYFQERYPGKAFEVFTNGIDSEFIQAQPLEETFSQSDVLTVLYAGNMGEGQGLHEIIPGVARSLDGRIKFRLIGDGGRKQQLKDAVDSAFCQNVVIDIPVRREELITAYQAADVLFLHLNDYDAFRKVLPSKIFEYAALGKPIWAGVAGYSADFIRQFVPNATVFSPCNVEEAVAAFSSLSLVTKPRHEFIERFSRVKIMQELASDIIELAKSEAR